MVQEFPTMSLNFTGGQNSWKWNIFNTILGHKYSNQSNGAYVIKDKICNKRKFDLMTTVCKR